MAPDKEPQDDNKRPRVRTSTVGTGGEDSPSRQSRLRAQSTLRFMSAPDDDESGQMTMGNIAPQPNSPTQSSTASPRSILSAEIADQVETEADARRMSMAESRLSLAGGVTKRSMFGCKNSPCNPKGPTSPASPTAQGSKSMSSSRVASILKGFPFFQDFEDGVVTRLAAVVEQAKFPAGTVLFRQDDPPGNCYVVHVGSIGIFVKATQDEDDEEPPPPAPVPARKSYAARASVPDVPSPYVSEDSAPSRKSVVRIPKLSRHTSNPAIDELELEKLVIRQRTFEGFSLYHAGSDLGTHVATLQAGSLTGEIALLHEQPRTASIKCLQDTSMIIIGKAEFESVLKAEMQLAREEKLNFCLDHLPGLRQVPVLIRGGRPHPSYYFRKVSVSKGHEFLRQGQVADDAIHIVFKGCLELRRTEPSSNVATVGLSSTVMKRSCMARPRSAVLRDLANARPKAQDEAMYKPQIMRHVGTLQAGGVFGSLPLTEAEPFTVVAKSGVEVFSVTADIARLPRKLLIAVQEYLTQATTYRLERLNTSRCADSLQQQTFTYKAQPRNFIENDFGLNLLLTGKIHPPPSFHQDAAHPGMPTRGTSRSASQPTLGAESRPQSAPAAGRLPGVSPGKVKQKVDWQLESAGGKLRPGSAPGQRNASANPGTIAKSSSAAAIMVKPGKALSTRTTSHGKRAAAAFAASLPTKAAATAPIRRTG